jgi:acetyl esterase/lipase
MRCTKIAVAAWGVVLLFAATSSAQLPELRLWGPVGPPADDALAVEQVRDIAYVKGFKADFFRHRLDLYLPKGKKQFPVVMFVHGGGWTLGDNRCCGLYTTVGEFLASRGIGVVMPNYRLSPWVKHPEHIKDVARAFAWTQTNIKKYGGDPDQLFLAGHSAGGHLVALLATDESYLKAEGLKTADVRGVIAVSGVYRIPQGNVKVNLGGDGGQDFHADQVIPLRAGGDKSDSAKSNLPAVPLTVNVYGAAFGADAKVRAQASPVIHVRAGLPPFLILTAENDLPTLGPMAEEFHRALADQGNQADFLRIENRNHNSIIFSAIQVQDPVARAIVGFVEKRTR